MIPGLELSDEAVTVGFTVERITGETTVVVEVTVEPELAGVAATPEVVGETLPGRPAVAGVDASPWLVGSSRTEIPRCLNHSVSATCWRL